VKVVLTRPPGLSETLAARLERLPGIDRVIMMPLVDIEPIPARWVRVSDVPLRGRYTKVVFVSRHAALFGSATARVEAAENARYFGVGRATAELLAAAGIEATSPARAGSDGLASLMQSAVGDEVLIVRGEGGREQLARDLASRGANVTYLEVYRRITRELSADERETLECAAVAGAVAVVYNIGAVEALGTRLSSEGKLSLRLLAVSERISDRAAKFGFNRIAQSDDVTDDAVVSTFQRMTAPGQLQE